MADETENNNQTPEENAEQQGGRISVVNVADEMKSAFIDYAMSVIISRALPDARDGLKPVHRRILYGMYEGGYRANRPMVKCASIVGDVLKKYHPHGDSAVYDTLVRMAQDFKMRYRLISPQGNFGSIDGDPAAAYRYTEARLAGFAEEMLSDIDKDTVDFVPNFDEKLLEPSVLPTRLPVLLCNGSDGIAVGMATNIPPHNLSEVIDGCIALIDNPKITIEELMEHVKGPDFPTGGLILGTDGIRDAYETGRGKITMQARYVIEEVKGGRFHIIIDEIPYQVNKANLVEKIADLVKDGKLTGISDLRDESDRNGMRIVIEVKRDAVARVVVNNLLKHTALRTNFNALMLAIVEGQPKILNLKDALFQFTSHREKTVTRRLKYELKVAKERAHILEGYIIALDNIDDVIETIKKSRHRTEAKENLMARFSLSGKQADAILDMQLAKLTGLEREKIEAEYAQLMERIAEIEDLLAHRPKLLNLIKDELNADKKKYGDVRKSRITEEVGKDMEMEDLIPLEDVVVTITRDGYIKSTPAKVYKAQHRGGMGKIGMTTKQEDIIEHLYVTTSHHDLLFFTDAGRVYGMKAYRIPSYESRYARGLPIVNLLSLQADEEIVASVPIDDFTAEDTYLLAATKNGMIKKTRLSEYSYMPATGKIGIEIVEGDRLRWIKVTNGSDDVILVTREGKAIRFPETDTRPMGRSTRGVVGIRMKGADEVVGMALAREGEDILTVTRKGYGKRTPIEDYRRQGRGGQGILTAKCTSKTGEIMGVMVTGEDDEMLIISVEGVVIRLEVNDISRIGRSTQGVRLIRLKDKDEVAAAALVLKTKDLRT